MAELTTRRGGQAPTDEPPRPERKGPVEPVVREFLGFRLGEETYALPLEAVHEILRVPDITEVPRAPRDVRGIVSVRGTITTIVDLRRRLQLVPTTPERQGRILLTRKGDEVIGLLVDGVRHVYRLADEEIELRGAMSGDTADYILGIGRPRAGAERLRTATDGDDLLILLDPAALLRD